MAVHAMPDLYVPDPSSDSERDESAAAMAAVIKGALDDLVDDEDLVTAVWYSPTLPEGGVWAGRPAGRGASALVVQQAIVPSTPARQGGALVVCASEPVDVRGLARLLARLTHAEVGRQRAERSAQGALRIANLDLDTGLGNRRAWTRALRLEGARVARHGRPVAVVVLDLDGLKTVNDEQGHAAGDRLIRRAAEVLQQTCRTIDVLCRVGGDEFAILAPETTLDQAQAFADRLRAVLSAAGINASLGVALGRTGSDTLEAWHAADAEMYVDKRARRVDASHL